MDSLGSLSAQLSLDVSDFTSALSTAQGQLSDFAQSAAESFTGFSLANVASQLGSFFSSSMQEAVGLQGGLEGFAASAQSLMGGVGDASSSAADAFAAGGSSMTDTAQQIEDAFIKHTEKLKQLDDEIATVTAGQNVIDAQEKLNQQL
jgi:hypothetical protein